MKILTSGNIKWAMRRYRYIALRSGTTIIGINCCLPDSRYQTNDYKISVFEDCYPITFAEYIRIKVPCIYAHIFLKADQYYA